MFSTGSVVISNSSRARSMRASASHAIGGTPVSSRNRRVSVRRDTCACLASVSRSSGRAMFSSIQSRSAASWSPLAAGRNRSTNCACPPCRCGGATSARAAGVGSGCAVVTPDDVETQIDPGRDAGGREDIAVVDEQAVRNDIHAGVAALQIVGPSPVRRGGAPVEDSGGGKSEGSCADRYEAGAARMRRLQGVKDDRRHRSVDVLIARDDHGLGSVDSIESG